MAQRNTISIVTTFLSFRKLCKYHNYVYNLRKPLGIYVEFFEYLRLLSFLKGFLFEHLVKKQLYSFMKSDNQWTLNGSEKDSQMCDKCFQGYSLMYRNLFRDSES